MFLKCEFGRLFSLHHPAMVAEWATALPQIQAEAQWKSQVWIPLGTMYMPFSEVYSQGLCYGALVLPRFPEKYYISNLRVVSNAQR